MSRGSLSPGCDCWSVGQSASAIVFTLTLAPVLHSVCFDTYSIVIVLTCGPGGWINTSVSCLVKLPLWCCNYITLVTLSNHYDIYSSTIVLTGGQTWSWSALCFGWMIPKRIVVDPWINTSVSCLVKLPLWCCNYLSLVPVVLWVFTMTSTPLQLSWLVDRHGVGLLSLCFGWLIPKRVVVDPWPMGFTKFSFMVNYLFSSTYYLI